MPMTIKCSQCGGVLPFQELMAAPQKCPSCGKDWDYSRIGKGGFRNKDV